MSTSRITRINGVPALESGHAEVTRALVAAGSVVVKDVPDYGLVAGNPARRLRWVGRAGVPLEDAGQGRWTCPQTGEAYVQEGETLRLHQKIVVVGDPVRSVALVA